MRSLALALVTFALVACSGDGRDGDVEPDPEARASSTDSGGDGVSAAKDAGSSGARQVSLTTELYTFAYSYPREAGLRQGLRMVLDRELETSRTRLIQQAREDKKQAEQDNYPFRPHSHATKWRVVAAPEGWLSLVAETDTYSGGAHGMHTFDARLWSDAEIKSFETADLFSSPAALTKAIRKPFCTALNAEREKRRGMEIAEDSDEWADECIDPVSDGVLVLDSSDGKAFDRIRVLLAPYTAGAYAEGSYEIELPVTKAVIAAAKPAYRKILALPQKQDPAR